MALGPMTSLQHLDLTRNNIGELPTGTFRQLSGLKTLKLAVNSMRQVNLVCIALHSCITHPICGILEELELFTYSASVALLEGRQGTEKDG